MRYGKTSYHSLSKYEIPNNIAFIRIPPYSPELNPSEKIWAYIKQFYKNKTERIEQLTKIKGIEIWSANYVLMKSIKDMSCITYGDSELNKVIHTIFKTTKKPKKEEIDAIFKDFKNWESYLNFYLWKYLN
ncbi:MAG: hypothetical protein L3J08_05640 [Flavobacteriaceae bacterium]|nr:hypothetical protein [Flavobacteriaceae bacterium]